MEVDLIIGPSASSSVVALSASFCPPPNQSPSFIVIAAWTVSPPTVIDESSLRRLRICMPDFEADKGGGGWDEEDESKKPARGKAGRDSLSGMPVGTCVMENEVRKVGKGGREGGGTHGEVGVGGRDCAGPSLVVAVFVDAIRGLENACEAELLGVWIVKEEDVSLPFFKEQPERNPHGSGTTAHCNRVSPRCFKPYQRRQGRTFLHCTAVLFSRPSASLVQSLPQRPRSLTNSVRSATDQ